MKTIIRKQMVFAVLILALFITGCGVKSTIAVDENGNSTSTSYMYFTEEEVRELAESDTSLDETKYIGDEQIDGTTYRVYKSDDSSTEETAQICTADKYYIKVSGEGLEEMNTQFYIIEVNMPKEIVNTNGTLSNNNRTVTWKIVPETPEMDLYAYTTTTPVEKEITIDTNEGYVKKDTYTTIHTEEDIKYITVDNVIINPNKNATINNINFYDNKIKFTKAGSYTFTVWTTNNCKTFTVKVDGTEPVVKGAADGKAYNKNITLKFSDKESGIKSAKLNNKSIKTNAKITKEGKYKLVVTDKIGNVNKINFILDKTAPTTNIKNKKHSGSVKISFADKLSGVKRATLDGKTIKNGYKISKKGTHTLKITDKAGNVKTVKFTVK